MNGAYPPVPELFCPSCLLGGYTLEELGPVTVAGRDAIAVAATPRRDVLSSDPGHRSHDRVEVAVDAEFGILLRRIETSGGELVARTELTDVTMNPPEAADPVRFAVPLGSHRSETPGKTVRGPDWATMDRVGGGLDVLIRHAPHRPGRGAAGEQPEAMPSPDPAPLEPADASPPPDEVLDLLYRSGEPRDLGATVRQWRDQAYRGRPARQLRVTRVPGGAGLVVGPLLFPDAIADAIIDAETGCLLRLISYAGDALVIWSELDDISTEPAGPDEFRVHVPPGTRTVEETGNWVVDDIAVMPGLAGTAARAAAETINRTAAAVSAARSFLDDLRGHR